MSCTCSQVRPMGRKWVVPSLLEADPINPSSPLCLLSLSWCPCALASVFRHGLQECGSCTADHAGGHDPPHRGGVPPCSRRCTGRPQCALFTERLPIQRHTRAAPTPAPTPPPTPPTAAAATPPPGAPPVLRGSADRHRGREPGLGASFSWRRRGGEQQLCGWQCHRQ